MSTQWTFDTDVAKRFDDEARTHIPHYEHVIALSTDIARTTFPEKRARLIDVGSALGRTLESMRDAGFTDVYGVDNSPAMLSASRVRENLILSDSFPAHLGPFDFVTANWTLHFITEPAQRAAYLRDIFGGLKENGMLVLTDKMESTRAVHDEYLDFKRRMGVSESEIAEKSRSLVGVLKPLPVEWYTETLREIGFLRIEHIDTAMCFHTFLCVR